MAKKLHGVDLDLDLNELLNGVIEKRISDPGVPVEGQIWFRTDLNYISYYDGTTILRCSTTADLNAHLTDTANPHDTTLEQARSQNNTVSGDIAMGGNKVTGLGTPTLSGDAATKGYVDGLIDITLKTPEAFAPAGLYPTTYAGNPVQAGDTFRITAAGTMGAITVNAEDLLIALVDTPGQTDANWSVAESNRDQATETVKGVAELATQAETNTGTDDERIVTPLKLQGKLASYGAAKTYHNAGVVVGGGTPVTVSHNLGLSAARACIVTCYDTATGEEIILKIVPTTTNAVDITKNGSNITVAVVVIGL